jgi:hypothetical protein
VAGEQAVHGEHTDAAVVTLGHRDVTVTCGDAQSLRRWL